jgi:hypothetical protein
MKQTPEPSAVPVRISNIWLATAPSINHRCESRRRSRGEGANDVSWRGEEVAWWRTSVATN